MIKIFLKNRLKYSVACLGLFLLFGLSLNVAAQTATFNFVEGTGLQSTANQAGYAPLTQNSTPEYMVGQIIKIVLSLVGLGFFGFMIYAGIVWMTAQGNDQKVTKAKNMIIESIVGIIIVVIAYAIAYFVISYFQPPVVEPPAP